MKSVDPNKVNLFSWPFPWQPESWQTVLLRLHFSKHKNIYYRNYLLLSTEQSNLSETSWYWSLKLGHLGKISTNWHFVTFINLVWSWCKGLWLICTNANFTSPTLEMNILLLCQKRLYIVTIIITFNAIKNGSKN